MKFFFRVRNKEVSPEELPEVPLRRSSNVSDRNPVSIETIKVEQTDPEMTESTPTITTTAATDASDCFVKPKSPKSPRSPKSLVPDKQSACNPANDQMKSDLMKRSVEVQKSVNNDKSDKLDRLEVKRNNAELKRSLSNEKAEKKSAKEDEKNQKAKNVKKCKSDSSEKRFENIKLKIDLSRQNSVTIIKSSVNDLKMKFKTERDNKNESSETTTTNKSKDEVVNGKRKQEIDVIKLAKVTEKSNNSNDSEVKYEIKSPKNSQCDNKEPVIKSESEIKVEPDIDEKKSEFLESFELTPTKSLSPEKLAIIAEKKKTENATINEMLSKKEMFSKNTTKSVPWHQPYGQPVKLNSKSSNNSVQNMANKITQNLLNKQRNLPSSSSSSLKSPLTILPKQSLIKLPSQSSKNTERSAEATVTLHSSKPNKDNPLKTTITKAASLSPKLLVDKPSDENGNKSGSTQGQDKNHKAEPTVSKRKSKEPIKNIPKRRFSLSLDSPMKSSKSSVDSIAKHLPVLQDPLSNIKLPLEPPLNRTKLPLERPNLTKLPVEESLKSFKLPCITEDSERSKVKKDVETKQSNSVNRIWCVDPCALGGKNSDKTANVQDNKTTNGNTPKTDTLNSLGKMLPPMSTSTPRKAIDHDSKGKIKINRMKPLTAVGPRKLPTILPKPSPSSGMPQITKMFKNPDTEIKQIPNGKDIKVYGPTMDMPKIPLGSTSPAYVPSFNQMHRNASAGYLNYALMNSRNRINDLPLGMRSPAYSPASPIYSPNSPQYSPNYNIPSQPTFKYMKSPAYVPNYPPMPNSSSGPGQSVNSLKTVASSPKKMEKLNENNKRPHSGTPDGNSPPEKQAKVQSLLESCKINFPSSLSITLHEQNDSSLNNPLFNPKRNSPVNNYIEIVKLPEIPASKEEVKQVTQPKREATKSPIAKPVTPKPSASKSPSPKPQVNNDKEKVLPDSTKVTAKPKKSPEVKSLPELNALDKNVAALLKLRSEKETGYQGKFLESILEKKRNELATPSPPKISKPNPDSSGLKKSSTPPLTPKVTKTTLKSQLKTNDTVTKPTKSNSPKGSSPKPSKSDAALDLSAHVNNTTKASNNNNNKSQLDQSDMTALFADAMARASHNPSFMLPVFGQQMGFHMQQALLMEHMARKAGHDKLNEALASFVKNVNQKKTENS